MTRKLLFGFLAALACLEASPALAIIKEGGDCDGSGAGAPAAIPPEKFAQSPGGVDMRTGQFLYSHTDLSIGDEHGMKLERMFAPVTGGSQHINAMGSLTHNWDIFFEEDRIQVCTANVPAQFDYQVRVSYGSRGASFRAGYDPDPDSFFQLSHAANAHLEFEYTTASGYRRPTKYIFHAGDGTKVTSRTLSSGISAGVAKVAEIREPDGTLYTFDYDTVSSPTAETRLRRVVSNRGYAILFEYSAIGSGSRWVVTKSCILNLAVTALPAISGEQICPAGVKTATYSYTSGEITQFTDQGGVATNLGAKASKLYNPGESTPYLTNTLATDSNGPYVTAQSFADGRTYSYSWVRDSNTPISSIMGGSYTDNTSHTVTVAYGKYKRPEWWNPTWYVTPGPETIVDENGTQWHYDYCPTSGSTCYLAPLQEATEPEGNKRDYDYNSRDLVTAITYIAKSGTGLPSFSETRAYGCAAGPCSGKPTAVTDARGNTTDYTYSTTHGGVLTETLPADANGIRPQTRYSYAQRYAWIKSGSSYAQASTPVWVLTSEEHCQMSAASGSGCAGGAADEVVTSYDYGPNSGPNNLWLRGKVVTANGESLRTCYSYDGNGNRISETRPNANLSSCP